MNLDDFEKNIENIKRDNKKKLIKILSICTMNGLFVAGCQVFNWLGLPGIFFNYVGMLKIALGILLCLPTSVLILCDGRKNLDASIDYSHALFTIIVLGPFACMMSACIFILPFGLIFLAVNAVFHFVR